MKKIITFVLMLLISSCAINESPYLLEPGDELVSESSHISIVKVISSSKKTFTSIDRINKYWEIEVLENFTSSLTNDDYVITSEPSLIAKFYTSAYIKLQKGEVYLLCLNQNMYPISLALLDDYNENLSYDNQNQEIKSIINKYLEVLPE